MQRLFLLAILVPHLLAAQEAGIVRGRVTDAATGQAVADARLTIEGTAVATISRGNGEYLFTAVPLGRHAVVARRVGYAMARQDVDVMAGQAATADFALRAAAVNLDEVVVTGLGAPAEKRASGNTIGTVDGAAIGEAAGATSIDAALQGRVTGAWISQNSGIPGGGVSIRLRGTGSILGGGEPLYVVDGVIVDNSADALVSMSANASGGGRGNSALTNRLADISTHDIERIEVLKGAAAAALYGSRANNGVIQIFTRRGRSGPARTAAGFEFGLSATPARYDLNMSPNAGWADSIYFGKPLGSPVSRYDLQDQIFRTAASAVTHVSITGGSGGTSYLLSGSRADMEGIVRPTTYERTGIRGSLGQELSPRLHVVASANYVQSKQELIPEGEQTQGLLTNIVFTPTTYNAAFNDTLKRYPYNPVLGPNPFTVLEQFEAPETVTRFVGSIEATFQPTEHITVRYLYGHDDYRQEAKYLQPLFSTGSTFTGEIQNPVRLSRQINHDLTATHLGRLSPTLGASTTLGLRYATDFANEVRAAASNLPPQQDVVGGAVPSASQSILELRTLGGFAEERLSFSDRLFVNAGLNVEASSAFGPDERWQLFPRLNASYVLHEAPFFRDSPLAATVSTLRFRAAYGQTGGQPPGAYTRFKNYVGQSHAGKPGLVASVTRGNDQLKPERQREIEGGFDLGLFEDRALVEFSYYHKRTFDLVLGVPQPPSTGFQTQLQNVGELTNRGWELALTTVNINTPNLAWRTTLSMSHNKNRVEKLVTSRDTLVSGYLNAVIEGQPIGVFWGGFYLRNPDGSITYRPVTVPVYGSVLLPVRAVDTLLGSVVGKNRIIGDPNPDLIASLFNTFDIGRKVQVSVLLDGRFGNDVANFTRRITELFGVDKIVEREISGDTIPRTFTLNPAGRSLIYEEYIEDGSYVKLREIAVRFRFEQPFGGLLGAETMDLRLAGRNLATWTSYGGLDPEINLFSGNTVARGVDFANTPLPRTFTVGVNFTF
jgi:TonB-dependent starch-binding outer membrane protein SusC